MKTLFTIGLLLFFLGNLASAQVGVLDTTFARGLGQPGILEFGVQGSSATNATGIQQQTDGKYVVGGKTANGFQFDSSGYSRMLALRLNEDGSIDSSFGTNGYSANNVFQKSFAHEISLQADGKILLIGQDYKPVGNYEDIGMLRLNTDGSLDQTFGTGGKVAANWAYPRHEEGHSIFQLPDGRIMYSGHTSLDGPSHTNETYKNNICVGRLLENGAIDSSWGNGGVFTLDFGDTQDYSKTMTYISADEIFPGGFTCTGSICRALYLKMTQAGTLDSTYGNNGVVLSNVGIESDCYRIRIQDDHKFVLSGSIIMADSNLDFFVQRFNSDGSVDTSFADDGFFHYDLGGKYERVEDFAFQSDNKIILAGYTTPDGITGDAVIIRLNPNGSIDTTFADHGIYVLDVSPGFDEVKTCLIDTKGRILIAGYAHNDNASGSGGVLFVVRVLDDGRTETLPPPTDYQISVFPNPASGTIKISCPSTITTDMNIEFFDLLGREISSEVSHVTEGNASVDLTRYAAGMYVMKVIDQDKIFTNKIIVY